MELEPSMLSKISQTKVSTVLYHLYVESKRAKPEKKKKKTESKIMITRGWMGGGVRQGVE